jgi:4-hydroxy-4-methyl-2-oxoglutarate aldolase
METDELSKALAELGTATLGESGAALMHPDLKPAWPGAVMAAPACPVRCTPGDNLGVHVAVAHAEKGRALVIDVGGVADRGYWGEVLTTAAQARALAGIVIGGGVRDIRALESRGFPVFATTIALRGATKAFPGSVGRPVRVGGRVVAAGDWVVGDADGVVAIAAGDVEEVLAAGRARQAKEADMFRALGDSRTTVELLGLDTSKIDLARP